MSTFSDEVGDTGGTSGRRDFLRKAAVGSGAFLVPMIIRVDPADAQALTSPPPEPPGRPESPPVDLGGSPRTVSAPGAGAQPRPGVSGSRVTGRMELARTGEDLDRLTVAGLAATAGGAALVLWSADAKAGGAKEATDSRSEE
jgi:hypothetical protein